MIDSEMKRDVTRRVHKEYKEFIAKVLKNGKWYAIDGILPYIIENFFNLLIRQ